MNSTLRAGLSGRRAQISGWLRGAHMLAFLPALSLAGFWLGGEMMLIAIALGLPALYGISSGARNRLDPDAPLPDLVDSAAAPGLAQQLIDRAVAVNLSTACLLVEAEGLDSVARQSGDAAAQALRSALLKRLRGLMKRGDKVMRTGDSRFMILLAPSPRLDLEALLTLADRVQRTLEEPVSFETGTHYLSVSIGFCGSLRFQDKPSGAQLVEAAQTALTEALTQGPSAIRAWSDSMRAQRRARKSLLDEVERALTKGQIQPWFQPQICTSTGRITGVEALARWIHPERGIVPPMEFLGALEQARQLDRLSEVMLQHSLTAMRGWDAAGIDIPRVSVNFSDIELRSPHLVERIKWELDRFAMPASRLGVEVLETVIADSPEGVTARNIVGLSQLGCQIDLDDFGTGHASIAALRRFTVHRLKIDRSFVTRVDRDEDQRRMLAAVLGLADRLGLETVAEGVESVAEHALLSQLGCDHVQGFGIARPMPADQLAAWAGQHAERIAGAQKLGRGAS
ncbi:diguanylate cyclase [Salipiger aestuarii]|uniref:EAL domain-containing protein (Putative c-di-GMP-specific phosphodiesterase class I) n=2 Tax=Salipiger aestuarii TaxID=568098 RepID=A0A327XWX8_9RHOB|nr:diguanylate cyclase [Salipiger aestuarii]KAB2540877.1 diguanylate cyclase [Salipiger aestuarii]RAK12416.1 EAL domain-containing protein (putative c-di-GMP-specific phosphodiesterase class I) [Salipiger aestuarii]